MGEIGLLIGGRKPEMKMGNPVKPRKPPICIANLLNETEFDNVLLFSVFCSYDRLLIILL